MKRFFKYGMTALWAILLSMGFQACSDDKDIVMITDELPLKVDYLYMVGDATPAGWSIDNPTVMTKDENNKFVFTYHGRLNVGEMKFPLSKGDWGATFAYAPAAGTEINANGVASNEIDIRKGGDDNKWRVTEAGIYTISIDLRERKIQASFEGTEPIVPLTSEWLTFIGDATPWGWNNNEEAMKKFEKTSEDPLQFTYEGDLKVGEFKIAYDQTDIPSWSNYLQAPVNGVTINHEGVSQQGMNVGGADNKWMVTEAGTYTLIFDLTHRTITVAAFTAAEAIDPWETETLYMLGQAGNGWNISEALPFKKVGNQKFIYAGELNEGGFKLMATNIGNFGTEHKDWFYAASNETVIDENGVAAEEVVAGNGQSTDNQWKVAKAGNYVLIVDMAAHKISAEYVGEAEKSIATAEARLVGDATPTGWDISGTAMTKVSSHPLEYTWEGHLKTGEFKIALTSTNNDYSGDWLQAPEADTEVNAAGIANGEIVKGGDDNKWKVTASGTYKIHINFSTKQINIVFVGA